MTTAYTKEEVRQQFLNKLHILAYYWATISGERSTEERCDGLVFSILNIFDGTSSNLPAMDIVLRPHEEDKQYCIDNNEQWYEDGMAINDDVSMHDMWFKKE